MAHPNSLANLKKTAGPGRPKGSRNKFSEKFIEDFYADWQEFGVEAIAIVRDTATNDYLKIAAGLLSKEVNVNVSKYDGLSDGELVRIAEDMARGLGPEWTARLGGGSGGDQETGGPEQAGKIPPLH